MIVRDLNIKCISCSPHEADPPLIVDSYAVLPFPVTSELLESISRWYSHVIENVRDIEYFELSASYSLYVRRQLSRELASENPLGLPVSEAPDHTPNNNVPR